MLPVLPTRDAVLLPGSVTELLVGRPCSVAAIRYAMKRDSRVVVVLQKKSSVEAPGPDDLRSVGCVSELLSATRESAEAAAVSVVGLERVRLDRVSRELLAETSALGWDPPMPQMPDHFPDALLDFVETMLRPQLGPEAMARLRCTATLERLAAISARFCEADEMQRILETQDFSTIVRALMKAVKPTLFERVSAWFARG